jgi:hypothetical protein
MDGKPHSTVRFFSTGTLLALAEHQTSRSADLAAVVYDQIGGGELFPISASTRDAAQVFSFPSPGRDDRSISLVKFTAQPDKDKPPADNDLLAGILRVNRKLAPEPNPYTADELKRISARGAINTLIVSPDWLVGPNDTGPTGTGGPGGHHDDHVAPLPCVPQFDVSDLHPGDSTPTEVDVYILDSTLASPGDAASMLKSKQGTPIPISVQIPNGYPASIPSGVSLPMYTDASGHPESVPSHGAFVASLIAGVADSAGLADKIHLYLVPILNERCVGTMTSFACGLETIQALRQSANVSRPFVINMSIGFGDPLLAMLLNGLDFLDDLVQAALAKLQGLDVGQVRGDLDRIFNALNLLLSAGSVFAAGKGVFIGAAGNKTTDLEGTYSQVAKFAIDLFKNVPPDILAQFPGTAYPACANPVIGVGALKDTGEPTDYTFLPDIQALIPDDLPPGQPNDLLPGLWAIGGEPQTGKGLIGQVGMATTVRWSGTSFAAAITAGVQAVLLARGSAKTLWQLGPQVDYVAPVSGTTHVGYKVPIKQI